MDPLLVLQQTYVVATTMPVVQSLGFYRRHFSSGDPGDLGVFCDSPPWVRFEMRRCRGRGSCQLSNKHCRGARGVD